jgi:hypothetical protein
MQPRWKGKRARGLDGGRARRGRGITRLHKRSAEGGDTRDEVADLALERRGARYNDGPEAAGTSCIRHLGVWDMIPRAAFIQKLRMKGRLAVAKRKPTKFGKDRRRKHHHWRVTVYYGDSEMFARVYINLEKARNFAKRQNKSGVVERTRITRIS